MPKGFLTLLGVSVLVLGLTACSSSGDSEPDSSGLRVIATTSIIGDVVSGVVGNNAEVRVLIPSGTDPHDFQPSARDVVALSEADLVFVNGLGLEAGLEDVFASADADGATIFALGPRLDPIGFGGASCNPDVESGVTCDPHVWMDPLRMGEAASLVARQMLDLDDSIDWAAAALSYQEGMAAADIEITSTLGGIPLEDRVLVTNHDSLGYFAHRYGFEVVGTVIPGGSTLADPSSEELAALVDIIRVTGTPAIFAETIESTALAETVAAEAGESIVVVELFTGSLGGPGTGAETLAGMLVTNAGRIAQSLG